MPVYIYEKDAFEKIIQVEGEEYRRFKTEEEFEDCSFDAFLKTWQKENILWWNYLLGKIGPDVYFCCPQNFGISTSSGNSAIYGLGGFNRYTVRISGEIMFMRDFSTEKYTKKARKIGFRIFEEVKC